MINFYYSSTIKFIIQFCNFDQPIVKLVIEHNLASLIYSFK